MDPGVVDECVEFSETLDRGGHGGRPRGLVRDIETNEDRFSAWADLCGDFRTGLLVHVGDNDVSALTREQSRCRLARPPRRTGDQRDSAFHS